MLDFWPDLQLAVPLFSGFWKAWPGPSTLVLSKHNHGTDACCGASIGYVKNLLLFLPGIRHGLNNRISQVQRVCILKTRLVAHGACVATGIGPDHHVPTLHDYEAGKLSLGFCS